MRWHQWRKSVFGTWETQGQSGHSAILLCNASLSTWFHVFQTFLCVLQLIWRLFPPEVPALVPHTTHVSASPAVAAEIMSRRPKVPAGNSTNRTWTRTLRTLRRALWLCLTVSFGTFCKHCNTTLPMQWLCNFPSSSYGSSMFSMLGLMLPPKPLACAWPLSEEGSSSTSQR